MSRETLYRLAPVWAQGLFFNAYAARISFRRRGKEYRRIVSELIESQYWSRSQLDAYTDACVRSIVSLAFSKSSYYRQVLDAAGISPFDIQGANDLRNLPLLTKDILRNRAPEFLTSAKFPRGLDSGHTSGTTGSPLSLWYNRGTTIFTDAVDWRQKIWAGMAESDWIGVLLGRVVVPPDAHRPPFWRVNYVHRQVWFSSLHLSPKTLPLYVEEIRRRNLHFLEGYPSTLFILAQYLIQKGIYLPMKAVLSSSETMHDLQRETIEAAFRCRVFDFYGHAERTLFASECEAHGGKHLAEEYGFAEIVDIAGNPVQDGYPGFLVGTSLHNTAMPMIRYRTGDITAIRSEQCPCGRTLRMIEPIATKAEDIIISADGRMVSPSILTHPFKPFTQILKSQLVQDRLDRLLVKIVPGSDFSHEHSHRLKSELSKRLGPGMEIEIQLVDNIPNETSGKFRWVISRVPHATHFSWDAGDDL